MLGGPICGQLGVWQRLAASRSVKSRFRGRSGPQRARTPIFQFLAPASRNFSKFLEISAEISIRNYVSGSLTVAGEHLFSLRQERKRARETA